MSQSDGLQKQPRGTSQVTLTFDRALTDAEIANLKLATNAADALRVPPVVKAAYDRVQQLQFEHSSQPDVGRLLSVLAATTPSRGRVLELGTGAGVGLAWIIHGLGQRTDVQVMSVELDRERAAITRTGGWPDWVSIIVGDGTELIRTLGSFDLIFADTPGGKIYDLQTTIAALRPGGVVLVDDMDLPHDADAQRRARVAFVRDQLLRDARLLCVELALSVGVILAARQRL
jgi:predicted O-methyltransferase YrrM